MLDEPRTSRLVSFVVVTLLTLSSENSRALAQSVGDPTDDPSNCLANTTGGVWATPGTIDLGGSVTVKWSVHAPSGCTVTQTLNGTSVDRNGTWLRSPMADSSFALR